MGKELQLSGSHVFALASGAGVRQVEAVFLARPSGVAVDYLWINTATYCHIGVNAPFTQHARTVRRCNTPSEI